MEEPEVSETKEAAAPSFESLLPPVDSDADPQETINIIQVAKDTIEEFLPFLPKQGFRFRSPQLQTPFCKGKPSANPDSVSQHY